MLLVDEILERKSDIPLLADFFIAHNPFLRETGSKAVLTDGALKKMTAYDWPGNVRELRNVIDRAIVNSDGEKISEEDIQFIPTMQSDAGPAPALSGSLEDIEKQTIINALKAQGGNKKATAKVLGIAYSTMCEKVKKYQIET